jgi:hypothetical protein
MIAVVPAKAGTQTPCPIDTLRRSIIVLTQGSIRLILRSIAISAFTRVFDALWRCVSKDGAGLMLRDGRFAASSA